MQKILFPMPTMNITQGYGYGTHRGTCAIDCAGEDAGIDYLVAPVTGVIKKKWANGNSVWLESTEPVLFADGTTDFATFCFTHDNNIDNLQVGQVIQQGQRFYEEGTAGNASGNHVHLEAAKGKFVGTGWYLNAFSVWTLNNTIPPQDAFFLKDVTIVNAGGYTWKQATEPAPALLGYQRISLSGTRYRDAPNTAAAIRQEFVEGDTYDFKGYVTGENVKGNPYWFVGKYTGGFAWSGGFSDSGLHDLPSLDSAPVVTPPVVVPPIVVIPPYSFTKDLECVTQVLPAANGNFAYGEIPLSPDGIVLHDFGTAGVDTFESAKNTFSKEGQIVSAHLVISQGNIVQMVAFRDRAYHAKTGNSLLGFEVDPAFKNDPVQIASVRKAIDEAQQLFKKKLTLHKHPEFVATTCGDDIDLALYDVPYPAVVPPVVTPEPPVPSPPSGDSLWDWLVKLWDVVVKFLQSYKKEK